MKAPPMTATQTFRELTYTMRPQDPHGDGAGLRFETGEHGGDYPDADSAQSAALSPKSVD